MDIAAMTMMEIEKLPQAPRQSVGGSPTANSPLVSVAIACYNHARFLPAAIESILTQSYRHFEIIVVDDGSLDNTAEVAARYPIVKYVRQHNQGLSAARNTGLLHAQGEFLVFLDADDCLLPRALEVGVVCLTAYPECAFASGHFHYINEDGSFRSAYPQVHVKRDHYLAMLRGNYIGMHAAVMYRRASFETVGGFDTSLRACEDYDLYLRITRQLPVFCHDETVAEYRQHGANMSGNPHFMLPQALGVLQRQWRHVRDHSARRRAYQVGRLAWEAHYGRLIFAQAETMRSQGDWQQSMRVLGSALRRTPLYSVYHSANWLYTRGYQWLYDRVPPPTRWSIARRLYHVRAPRRGSVRLGALGQADAQVAAAPARSVTQHYLEQFVVEQAHYVRGTVLHLGNSCDQLDLARATSYEHNPLDVGLIDDLATVQPQQQGYDCILLLDVLHRIYDLRAALATVYKWLKPGGVLLATLPGIGLVKDTPEVDAGYWSFTASAATQLFTLAFAREHLRVTPHGNVLAATAWLHGLEASALTPAELDASDPQFQLVLTVRAIKVQGQAESEHHAR